jgi:hypothetical protein
MEAIITNRQQSKRRAALARRWVELCMLLVILLMLAAAIALPAFAKSSGNGRLTTGHEDLELQLRGQAVMTMLVLRFGETQ